MPTQMFRTVDPAQQLVVGLASAVSALPITLSPTAIGFHNPISVDSYEPTANIAEHRVILSANYPYPTTSS